MRLVGLSLAMALVAASSAMATVGDSWILGIDHIDNPGFFQTFTGAGYSGPQASGDAQYVGNAYGPPISCYPGHCSDGVARIFWSLSGLSTNGHALPSTAELYSVKFYGTSQPANNDWQPIEVDFNGPGPGNGEAQKDPNIPWFGQYGTNHQWIGADAKTVGAFVSAGPGPQAPKSAAYNASGFDGSYMWLNSGSWLYAKWNFSNDTRRSWSAIQLTQVTPAIGPPPVGDYNKNNYVDAADYVLWRKTFDDVNPAAGRPADGNFDGYVDDYDYDIWRQHFGNTATGIGGLGFNAVPEPATLSLTAFITIACLAAPRRRDFAVGHFEPARPHNCDK
jgi:hypothetical protein